MDEKPKKRWFRFRISTVLILTAIAAWAMALRPFVYLIYFGHSFRGFTAGTEPRADHWMFSVILASTHLVRQDHLQVAFGPDPQLLGPFAALAAFLAWKAAWGVIERRRRQSVAPE